MQRVSAARHVASRSSQGANARWPQQIRHTSRRYAKPPPRYEPPAPTRPSPQTRVANHRAAALVLASFMGAGIVAYSVQLFIAVRRAPNNPAIRELSEQKDVSGRYDDTADNFDVEVGMSEWFMGVNRLRKRLASQCKGQVLEVSCGTGRNLSYFDIGQDGKVESLTFVDLSPRMVELCRKKWDILYGRKQSGLRKDLVVRFLPASALGNMPLTPTTPSRKYDAIIQTMGLCSTPTPVELLENMVQHLDTSNPDSRIFLLEHGRSYRQWLNKVLDSSAEKHAEIHGCWFNRDIGALVEDAATQSGLEVVKERRHHLGTTWVFELKPIPGFQRKPQPKDIAPIVDAAVQNTKSWFSWFK